MTNKDIKPTTPFDSLVFFEDEEDLQKYLNVSLEDYFETGDFQELGRSLKTLIKAKEKVSHFSAHANITRQHLYALFNNEKEPQFKTIVRIIKALGFTIKAQRSEKKIS